MLQDCFEHTNWQIFRDDTPSKKWLHLEEYVSSVCGYISTCMDDVTITRRIIICPDQKPWLNREVQGLLKVQDSAFGTGDALTLRAARRELEAGIKSAKASHALQIQGHFSTNDPQSTWNGIKTITDLSRRDAECPQDPSFPDALSRYACFEASNSSTSSRLIPLPGKLPLGRVS